MYLDLEKAAKSGEENRFRLPPEAILLEEGDLRCPVPMELSIRVSKIGENFWVEGTVSGEAELDCGRCLERVRFPISSSFRQYLQPEDNSEAVKDEERELEKRDLEVASMPPDSRLDVRAIAREQIYLETPMRVLCRPECKGLCSRCGSNLNLNTCSCPKNEIDPRLTALEAIKKQLGDS